MMKKCNTNFHKSHFKTQLGNTIMLLLHRQLGLGKMLNRCRWQTLIKMRAGEVLVLQTQAAVKEGKIIYHLIICNSNNHRLKIKGSTILELLQRYQQPTRVEEIFHILFKERNRVVLG